jgi:hypothetical protein
MGGSARRMSAWLLGLAAALLILAVPGVLVGCSGDDGVRDSDVAEDVPLFDEDRSWVTEELGAYVGTYGGRFERFFEGRGTVSVPLSMTVTRERVTGSWAEVADVPGGEPLRWHTRGSFSADMLEDGTFEGEGSAVTYTTGASEEGTITPQDVLVLGRLSDDALVLGDIVFEEGALTFQGVRGE